MILEAAWAVGFDALLEPDEDDIDCANPDTFHKTLPLGFIPSYARRIEFNVLLQVYLKEISLIHSINAKNAKKKLSTGMKYSAD